MSQLIKIRKFENMHILLWLLKDTCWVLTWRTAGMIMVIPTICVAVYITWRMRAYRAELLHNLAVCFWIMANSIWMAGEFYLDDTTRPVSQACFVAGLICIGWYYLRHYRRDRQEERKGSLEEIR